MREKRLIGGLAAGAEENWKNLLVRNELILKIRIEVRREMPNLFDHIDGRINELNACLTENPRREDVERIKKQPQKSFSEFQKSFSVFIAAPIVEKAQPDSASHRSNRIPSASEKKC